MYLTPELAEVLNIRSRRRKTMKDEFVSAEHLFITVLEAPNHGREILSRFKVSKDATKKVIEELRSGRMAEPLYRKNSNPCQSLRETSLNWRWKTSLTLRLSDWDNEIRRIMEILSRRTKNNPIFNQRARHRQNRYYRRPSDSTPARDVYRESLKGKELVSLDLGLLIAGTKYRGV